MALTEEELNGFTIQAKPAAIDLPKLDKVQVQANSGLSQEEIDGFKPLQSDPELAKENLSLSYGADSDAIAEQKRKQRELGLKDDFLLSDDAVNKALENKQREEFRNSLDEKKNPKTAEFYSNKSNSDVAWEDKDKLSSFERLMSDTYKKNMLHKGLDVGKAFVEGVQEKGFVEFTKAVKDRALVDAGYSHLIGTFGTMRAQSEIGEQTSSLFGFDIKELQRSQMEFMASLFGDDKESAAAWYDSITADSSGLGSGLYKNQGVAYQAKSDKLKQMTDYESPEVNKFLEAAGSAGASTAATIPSIIANKNPLTLLGFGNMVFGQSFSEGRDKYGLSVGDSFMRASIQAGSEVGSEFLSLPLWDKIFKGGAGAESLIKLTAGESATESLSTIGSNYADWVYLPENKDKPFTEFLGEQPSAVAQTIKDTLITTPMQLIFGKSISVPTNYVRDTLDNRRLNKSREAVTKIIQGENDQKIIDKSIELSQNILTYERDPEILDKFVSNLQEEQRDLYVPADIVKDIVDLPDYMASQIDGLGGDVVIPMSKFMSDVARNEQLMTAIRPHLTLRESGESLYSIEQNGDNAIKTMLDEARQVLQEKEDIDTGYEDIKQQLLDSGVIKESEADANATLVKEYVQRVSKERGVTIPEAYDYLKLKIAKPNEDIEAQDIIDQDPLKSAKSQGYEGEDIGESKEWVSAMKKFGAEGMTKEARMARAKEAGFDTDNVYYHGTSSDFDSFRKGHGGVYFSDSSSYADRYARGNVAGGENIIPVRLKLENTFDTRNPEHRKIYNEKFLNKFGNGTPLREDGLPDWAESKDFQEFFEAEGLPFDSAIIGEPPSPTNDGGFRPEKSILVTKEENIRSINAAFDPDYSDSPNILAQSLNNLPEITRKIIGDNNLLAGFTILAKDDGAFSLPITNEKTVQDILKAQVRGVKNIEIRINHGGGWKSVPESEIENITNASLKLGKNATLSWVAEIPITIDGVATKTHFTVYQNKDEVWIDVSKLKEGGGGNAIYNAIANYAYNTGKVFIGDPQGLSKEAQSRRLENMISSALKFGTTDHLSPHSEQLKERAGVPAIKWKDGDFEGNLENMIKASYEFTLKQFPEISNLMYDTEIDNFVNTKDGKVWNDKEFDELARKYNEKSGDAVSGKFPRRRKDSDGEAVTAGRRTLERAAFTHTLLRGTSKEISRLLAKLSGFGSKRLTGKNAVFYQSEKPTNITTPDQLVDKLNPSKERETSLLQKKLNQIEALSKCLKKG